MTGSDRQDTTIRNYRPGDFENFASACREGEELEPTGRPVTAQAVREHLGQPGYDPEKDLFIAESGGRIVAWMDTNREPAIGRAVLSCWVHPEQRRKNFVSRLLDRAVLRAKESGVQVLHMSIPEQDTGAAEMLALHGFRCVRKYLELRLAMSEVSPEDLQDADSRCRNLLPGEEEKLARIQNLSFGGQWGYNPNTVEEIRYRANLGNHSPEDVVLACDGEHILGYCWTELAGAAGKSGKAGRIFMIGTDPDYQGQGVGKTVLMAGLARLRKRGAETVDLTVDSENAVANVLYNSFGFRERAVSLWYEKAVD